MRLTKYSHACVSIEDSGRRLVIDPGGWTSEDAVSGLTEQDAIAITHEHPDHLDVAKLAASKAPVWTNAAVAAAIKADTDAKHSGLLDRLTVVGDGDRCQAAGFDIEVFGQDHAVILPELGVPCVNTAFLVGGAIYHPGDSWTLPGKPVEINLLPISAPWFDMPAAVAYARELAADTLVPIHDALLSDTGRQVCARIVSGAVPGKEFAAMVPGDSRDLAG